MKQQTKHPEYAVDHRPCARTPQPHQREGGAGALENCGLFAEPELDMIGRVQDGARLARQGGCVDHIYALRDSERAVNPGRPVPAARGI